MNGGVAGLPVQFSSPLGGAAWAVLAGVPVGIIALYFLKLRRRPVQVPSTLLWKRSLEDLHVNSLFQKLRRNLLLFLQLLAVFLAMAALTGPRFRGTSGEGQRFVLAIDNSASMSATDVSPTRLAKAKEEAKKVVQGMGADDLAMVIAFSDRATVISNYTADSRSLLGRIDGIGPTENATSLLEALQVAAGLANPSKQIGEGVVATSVVAPSLFIYTDGGFADVEGFSLGNLKPEVIVVGPPAPPAEAATATATSAGPSGPAAGDPSDNVAILALQTRRGDEQTDVFQVFGRVHNFRAVAVETEAQLLRHDPDKPARPGQLVDAIALSVPARGDQSFKFEMPAAGLTELEVKLAASDAQPLDDRAFAVIGTPRKADVLLVTAGNRYLADTLQTPTAVERAEVTVATPEQAKADPIARDVKAGRYDLVIYDHTRPDAAPEANALYFGAMPPGPAYDKTRPLEHPVILDWDSAHPLLRYVRDLSTVAIAKATGVDPPPGSSVLIESNLGSLAFVVPREGFSDVVVGFPLLEGDTFNTTWFKNISFPLFLFNCLQVLGDTRESAEDETHLPGKTVFLRPDAGVKSVQVEGPGGTALGSLERSSRGRFAFTAADRTGLYHARWGPSGRLAFAVNPFDPREANIAPRGLVPADVPPDKADAYKIKIGYNPVAGTKAVRAVRKDWWVPFAVAALIVVLVEWYIYNRRVYV